MLRSLILGVAAVVLLSGAAAARSASPTPIVFAADRAPSLTGEIFRLDPNGNRVDLSRSPFQDAYPSVSPNGRKVAFISDRSGAGGAVYEEGIGGRGLVRVGPVRPAASPPIAWQPHGTLIAYNAATQVVIAAPGRKAVKFPGQIAEQPWSPDGRELLVVGDEQVQAISPQGHVIWSALAGASAPGAATWSAKGLVAFPDDTDSIVVHDETGRLRFRTRILSGYGAPSWSPDGSRLALIAWPRLLEWTSTGKLVLDRRARGGDIVWARKHWLIDTHGSSRWLDPRSPNGKLAIVTSPPPRGDARRSDFAIGVAPTVGGAVKTYARVPGCASDGAWEPAVDYLQFAGHSIVYEKEGDCGEPIANLYSVEPGGGGLTRLTDVAAQETQPALSPDRSEIAYVWAEGVGDNCKGCSDGIRIASADGAPLRTLTDPQDCTFDDSPTWSPNGTTILYSEGECDSPGELYTISASGGAPHDLGIVGQSPAWGPSLIAYDGADQSDPGLWTAKPDGSDRVLVTRTGGIPAWSSDGRLAYLEGASNRYVVVGSERIRLPFSQVTSLAWSADGSRFVVTARAPKAATFDVYTVKTNGTDPIRLTKNYDALGAHWG